MGSTHAPSGRRLRRCSRDLLVAADAAGCVCTRLSRLHGDAQPLWTTAHVGEIVVASSTQPRGLAASRCTSSPPLRRDSAGVGWRVGECVLGTVVAALTTLARSCCRVSFSGDGLHERRRERYTRGRWPLLGARLKWLCWRRAPRAVANHGWGLVGAIRGERREGRRERVALNDRIRVHSALRAGRRACRPAWRSIRIRIVVSCSFLLPRMAPSASFDLRTVRMLGI